MTSTAHILVVSHDQEDSRKLTQKLRHQGYDSISHSGSGEALNLVQSRKPDLVIIAGNDGASSSLNLTRALKGHNQTAKVPVILIAPSGNASQQMEGFHAGADACLPFPYHDVHLFGRIEALARLGVMQEELLRRMQTSAKFGLVSPVTDSSTVSVKGDTNFLLVGPADENLEQIEFALSGNGTLVHAQSPATAKNYLERRRFDAILLNIPSGKEETFLLFAQDVRRDSLLFNIPIICIMRPGARIDTAAPYAAGAADLFMHPINITDFRIRLEVLVSRQRHRDSLIKLLSQNLHAGISDSLTGLYSYGYMMEHLNELVMQAHVHNRSLTLGVFILDNLQEINNQFGYAMGDKILRQVGLLVGNLVRGEDLPSRYSGRSIALVMPETRLAQGEYVARRIGSVINFTEIMADDASGAIRARTSTGVASLAKGMSTQDLVNAAINNCG